MLKSNNFYDDNWTSFGTVSHENHCSEHTPVILLTKGYHSYNRWHWFRCFQTFKGVTALMNDSGNASCWSQAIALWWRANETSEIPVFSILAGLSCHSFVSSLSSSSLSCTAQHHRKKKKKREKNRCFNSIVRYFIIKTKSISNLREMFIFFPFYTYNPIETMIF